VSSVVTNAALDPPPLCSPVHEIHHMGPVFPGKSQKFSRVQIIRFRPEKSLKPPAHVRALPGIQAIPACNVPVVPQCLEHRSYTGKKARSQTFFVLAATERRGKMLMHQKPPRGAPFPNSCIPDLCFYILTVFCFFR
jgi:hypothetical protein